MKILLYTNDIIEIKSHEHFIEIEQTYKREQKISFFNDITQKYETSVLRHVELNNNKLYFNYKKKIWHKKLKNTTKKLRSDIPIEIKNLEHLKDVVKNYDRYTSLKINCERCGKTNIWKIRPCYSNYNYDILMCPYCKEKYNNLQKYGVECSSQRPEVQQKVKDTLLKNYGVDNPLQILEIKEKIKINNIKKYGYAYIAQIPEIKEKIKQTCLDKYGTTSYVKTKEYLEKTIETNRQKYGVDWPQQKPEIHKKSLFGKYYAPNGKVYDSSWEYLFEQYLIEKNISYTYQANTTFKWFDIDNKEHTYIPDFSIINEGKEEFIEIKGDHFFDKDNNFINPYDKSEKGYANAKLKYECMINAGVKIYTSKELIKLGINI